jgi:hypothetical protein
LHQRTLSLRTLSQGQPPRYVRGGSR